MFSLRTVIGKQAITFFATNNYNPIFTNINVNAVVQTDVKKDKLGLEKPTSLSVLANRITF